MRELFGEWLECHYPERAAHVMSLVRQSREGRENDPRFGSRMSGEGVWAQLLAQRLRKACQRYGLDRERIELDMTQFIRPARVTHAPSAQQGTATTVPDTDRQGVLF